MSREKEQARNNNYTIFFNFFLLFIIISSFFLISILFLSCQYSDNFETSSISSPDSFSDSSLLPEASPVKVIEVQRGEIKLTFNAPAEAVAERKISLKSEVSGIIKNLYVRESQPVKPNELLMEIEDSLYQLQLQQREATRLRTLSELLFEQRFSRPEQPLSPDQKEKIKKARENYEKAAFLLKEGLISLEQYELIKREYEQLLLESGEMRQQVMAAFKGLTQAEIEVKMAELQLEKTKIRAPFAGIITDIRVFPGQSIDAGTELFTLVDIARIKVVARVLEGEIGQVHPGQEVEVKFFSFPDQKFKGKVEAISPLVNSEDKTCRVYIDVANTKEEIKPGMQAEVEIAGLVLKNRVIVPQKAVLVRGGRKLVFVVEEQRAKWRYVETGAENESSVEIISGVKEGEKVIIEGHLTLGHDALVRIIE